MFNTFPNNPFPPSSESAEGEKYTLPIAGAETLGGVKVGNGLSMNAETGVLSNSNPTPYVLPTAGAETLGGVKVGSGLSMNAETGALSADAQLPANPSADGVKVLTATTESGETVKSWEEPASGGLNYSTTEQNTGIKWIDDNDIYSKTYSLDSTFALDNSAYTTIITDASIDTLIKVESVASDGTVNDGRLRWNQSEGAIKAAASVAVNLVSPTITIFYTKTAVQQTRKRGK